VRAGGALPVARLKALAREPLMHFLFIGAGIYGLDNTRQRSTPVTGLP